MARQERVMDPKKKLLEEDARELSYKICLNGRSVFARTNWVANGNWRKKRRRIEIFI